MPVFYANLWLIEVAGPRPVHAYIFDENLMQGTERLVNDVYSVDLLGLYSSGFTYTSLTKLAVDIPAFSWYYCRWEQVQANALANEFRYCFVYCYVCDARTKQIDGHKAAGDWQVKRPVRGQICHPKTTYHVVVIVTNRMRSLPRVIGLLSYWDHVLDCTVHSFCAEQFPDLFFTE